MASDLVRVGTVSAFHHELGTVDVSFFTAGNPTAIGLATLSHEYRPLEPGDMVLCLFTGDGDGRGFCLGRVYSAKNLPANPGEKYTRVNFRDAFVEHDREAGTLTLSAETVVIKGGVQVEGAVTAREDVVASGVSLIEHDH